MPKPVNRVDAVCVALHTLRAGATLRAAAAAGGVSVATLARWRSDYPGLDAAFKKLLGIGKENRGRRVPYVEFAPVAFAMSCPRCGSALAYRRGRRGGTFTGCTGYPACTF